MAKKDKAPAPAAKPRKERVKVPEGETKDAKFKRLGGIRLNKALKTIGLIGNLSGPGYSYTQEQVEVMRTHLTEAVKNTLAKFTPRTKEEKKAAVITL